MKILRVTGYLDGGTVAIATEKKIYYVDGRLRSKTAGEVFDSYPSDDSNIIPQSELWELVSAVKEYGDIDYRKHILHLLGTA